MIMKFAFLANLKMEYIFADRHFSNILRELIFADRSFLDFSRNKFSRNGAKSAKSAPLNSREK